MIIRRVLVQLAIGFFCLAGSPIDAFAQGAPPAESTSPGRTGIAAQTSAIDQDYILGRDDIVEVDLLGRADFKTRARIAPDGTIQLPYLGTVHADNRTSKELREQITQALEKGGYFSHPILDIAIVSFASRYVTVLGNVRNPGLIPVDRPYRLSELIARVGGVLDNGAAYVEVRPSKGAPKTYLVKALATGDETDDPFISPGEKIYVPIADTFYISGAIKAPGQFTLLPDMTLRMALARASGLTDSGSDRHIKIMRHGKKVDHIDLDGKVEPGDVIVVGERLF
jgi:polysaccharide export outer membrane protein